ncbi:MAG TPA: hypothetical protein VFH38_09135 [Jatrophihabitans sp.]|nr:hypothetical protein [Jatrophihabitans sp.]
MQAMGVRQYRPQPCAHRSTGIVDDEIQAQPGDNRMSVVVVQTVECETG